MSETTNVKAATAKAPAKAPAKEMTKEQKAKALSEARSAATSRLNKNHRDEFNQLVAEEAAQRGLTWTPQLTPEEKALKQARALIAEHPDLLAKLADQPASEPPA